MYVVNGSVCVCEFFSDPLHCSQAAHAELTWLNEREDREAGRDWADKNLNLTEVEQYYEVSTDFFYLTH